MTCFAIRNWSRHFRPVGDSWANVSFLTGWADTLKLEAWSKTPQNTLGSKRKTNTLT